MGITLIFIKKRFSLFYATGFRNISGKPRNPGLIGMDEWKSGNSEEIDRKIDDNENDYYYMPCSPLDHDNETDYKYDKIKKIEQEDRL